MELLQSASVLSAVSLSADHEWPGLPGAVDFILDQVFPETLCGGVFNYLNLTFGYPSQTPVLRALDSTR